MAAAKSKPAQTAVTFPVFGTKVAEDAAAFGKSNFDALVQAGSVFARGFEELTKSVVSLTQSQVEANIAAAKAVFGAKSLTELGDLQKAYARTAFDTAISEASRLSELAIRISNETAEPLTARVQATFDHLTKPLAA